MGRRLSEAIAGYAFLLPFLGLLLAFVGWPLLSALWLSLHAYDLFSPPRWVGLDNYRVLLGRDDFWRALANTTLYTLVVVSLQTAAALGLALLLDQRLRGRTLFRVALFLPSVTSSVAISLIFMFLYFQNGVLNQVLAWLHLDRLLMAAGLAVPVDWLGDFRTALWALMAQNIWSTAGFFMVVFLAGLQDIPETLYEAARLDGASAWSRFRHVTLPLLRPTTFYVATIGMIGCFQVFDQVFVMTGGGPLDSTLTIAYLLYREAFMAFNMGDACAIAFVLAALILACTLVQRRLMGA